MERNRIQLLALVSQALDPKLSDADLGEILAKLDLMVPHPDIGGLMFHHVPELTPEEIVDRALAYQPMVLGHDETT